MFYEIKGRNVSVDLRNVMVSLLIDDLVSPNANPSSGADKCCDGEICCEYGYCLDKARICCPKGGCDAGKLCCGQSNCSPSDGACCRDESSCQKGNECVQFGGAGIMCCSDKKCTAHVENGKTISAPSSTATSTSTSKPGETVTEGSAAGATTTAAGGNARGSSTTSSSGPRKTSSTVTDPGSSSADDDQSHNNNGGTALGSTDSGPNIGAIVGGVVGAVGGIALIALIIVCVLRRNKRTMEEINSQHQRGSQYQGSMAPRSVVSGHGQASLRSARSPVSPVTGGFSPRSQFDKYSPSPLGGASSPTQDWNALSARSVGASMGMSVLGSPAPSQLAQSQHAVSLRDTMTVASTSVRAASISAMPSIGPGGKPQTEICEAPTHIAELRRGPIHEAPTDMSDSHRGEMQEME